MQEASKPCSHNSSELGKRKAEKEAYIINTIMASKTEPLGFW